MRNEEKLVMKCVKYVKCMDYSKVHLNQNFRHQLTNYRNIYPQQTQKYMHVYTNNGGFPFSPFWDFIINFVNMTIKRILVSILQFNLTSVDAYWNTQFARIVSNCVQDHTSLVITSYIRVCSYHVIGILHGDDIFICIHIMYTSSNNRNKLDKVNWTF